MPKGSVWSYRECPSWLTYDGARTNWLDAVIRCRSRQCQPVECRVGQSSPPDEVAIRQIDGDQAIERFENNQRMMPRAIKPTSPFDPRSFTSATMLPTTLPKNGRLAPTSSDATMAKASSISPISVSDPIQPLIRVRASMSDSP